jgi:hypothetical protein
LSHFLSNNRTDFMPRLLRGLFCLFLVATLVAPLPAGESAASPIPVCCLAHGEHHCMGQMLGGDEDTPAFSASSKCPYSPLALAALRGLHVAPPQGNFGIFVAPQFSPLSAQPAFVAIASLFAVRFKRGPPSFLR